MTTNRPTAAKSRLHKAKRALAEQVGGDRGNPAFKVGAPSPGPDRPNHLGITTCAILSVKGLIVEVRGLDAIDGTPVLDLKPYMQGFQPRGSIREPDWAREIMKEYW